MSVMSRMKKKGGQGAGDAVEGVPDGTVMDDSVVKLEVAGDPGKIFPLAFDVVDGGEKQEGLLLSRPPRLRQRGGGENPGQKKARQKGGKGAGQASESPRAPR